MQETPHDIQFPLADFDRRELPEDQREFQGDAYLQAVREHLAAQFVGQGGVAEIAVTHDRVIIRWKESDKAESLAVQGANHLKEGNTEKGMATLRVALERDPDDAAALFNLGMSLFEGRHVGEALELLERLVAIAPDYPSAWVALGVAQGSFGEIGVAIQSFREALARHPQDPFAHKNLGAALSQAGQLEEAREHLKAAVVLLPSDAQAWLNLATNLEQSGNRGEAESAYTKVMMLDPGGQLSEIAELGRNRITEGQFRKAGGDFRPDALTYCGEALRMFDGMSKSEVQRITLEIAMVGAKGLSVNDPSRTYQLRSLPGDFSALRLLCIEYVGFKTIDPSVDIGFDLAAEYEKACQMNGRSTE